MKAVILNALIFQVGWFCCVLAGANQMPWLGSSVALLIVAWHLSGAARPSTELALVLIAATLGGIWDSLLVSAGVLQYPSGTLVTGTAPHWIVAMWLLFATTLNVSLRWLKARLALAALMGALAGPAAYFAGYKLGGVQIPDLPHALAVLAVGWSLFMPLLMVLSNRLDGFESSDDRSRLIKQVSHV